MQAPELSLAAAIRDIDANKLDARLKALRSLAPALLVDLDKPGPLWLAATLHDSGATVTRMLFDALGQEHDIPSRGQAAVSLGMLGDASVIDVVAPWLTLEGEQVDACFQRECAVIAISFIGAAAARAPDNTGRHALRQCMKLLSAALESPAADVRFQAAVALVEVADTNVGDVEALLRDALKLEDNPEVRHNLVDALSRLEHPSAATLDALAKVLEDPQEGASAVGLAAAMILAGQRRPEAGPRLVTALGVRLQRDDALEALAVLGPAAPDAAVERARRIATGVLTTPITRVRAAYALARMCSQSADANNPGLRWLARLAWHPRPAVREAVTDARRNLEQLAD